VTTKYFNFYNFKALKIYPNRDSWFGIKPSGNPAPISLTVVPKKNSKDVLHKTD
jgi:hypothetical protein